MELAPVENIPHTLQTIPADKLLHYIKKEELTRAMGPESYRAFEKQAAQAGRDRRLSEGAAVAKRAVRKSATPKSVRNASLRKISRQLPSYGQPGRQAEAHPGAPRHVGPAKRFPGLFSHENKSRRF
jgi:hypothetical protein